MTADCWNYVLPDALLDQSARLLGKFESSRLPGCAFCEDASAMM
jgi:hypothetical protein